MQTYRISMVGDKTIHEVEASSPYAAIAQLAGCNWEEVKLPIWRRGPRYDGSYDTECFMPLDNSGRQWVLHNNGTSDFL